MTEKELLVACITQYILLSRQYEGRSLYLPMLSTDCDLIEWAVSKGIMERCPHVTSNLYWFVETKKDDD